MAKSKLINRFLFLYGVCQSITSFCGAWLAWCLHRHLSQNKFQFIALKVKTHQVNVSIPLNFVYNSFYALLVDFICFAISYCSTKGVGGTAPDFSEAQALEDGLIVPLGKPKKNLGMKVCTSSLIFISREAYWWWPWLHMVFWCKILHIYSVSLCIAGISIVQWVHCL